MTSLTDRLRGLFTPFHETLIGPEPEWNYIFEIDGIVYNRYDDLAHAGQQDIMAIRPDYHSDTRCELCNPSLMYPDSRQDAYRWIPEKAAKREDEIGQKLLS